MKPEEKVWMSAVTFLCSPLQLRLSTSSLQAVLQSAMLWILPFPTSGPQCIQLRLARCVSSRGEGGGGRGGREEKEGEGGEGREKGGGRRRREGREGGGRRREEGGEGGRKQGGGEGGGREVNGER